MKNYLRILTYLFLTYGNTGCDYNQINKKSKTEIFKHQKSCKTNKIILDAFELSKFPDTTYISTNEKFLSVKDSFFIKKVFYPNKGMYFYNKVLIKEDFSLSGVAEYNFLPKEVYKKNKTSIKILGKLSRTSYTSLILRYYDVNSVRYYLMNFDENLNIIASICFFAYSTIDPKDVYQSKDENYFLPFIEYNHKEDNLIIYTRGFLDINYKFRIQNDGTINLEKKTFGKN